MSGRSDLSAGYGKLNKLVEPQDDNTPVDLASLPENTVLVLDGIRFDTKKVVASLSQENVRRRLQAFTFPTDSAIHVSQSSLNGKRTIELYDLVKEGSMRITVDDTIYNLFVGGVTQYIWDNRSNFAAKPTPVDLETLPAGATVTLDNLVVSAHKLRQLVLKKLTGTPAENRKFQLEEVDSAKDTGLYHNKVTLEHLSADDVYVIGAHEYERIEVEQLLIFNARKLSPKNILQRFTDSVKADWEGFKAEANAWYEKHPLLSKLLIVVLTASVAIRILKFTDLVDVIGRNMLGYMQESILDPNGNVATSVILGNSNMEVALGLIDLVFIAFGGYIGYRITRKSNKPLRNIPFGVLAGILVFRGVQLIVFVAFASTLH